MFFAVAIIIVTVALLLWAIDSHFEEEVVAPTRNEEAIFARRNWQHYIRTRNVNSNGTLDGDENQSDPVFFENSEERSLLITRGKMAQARYHR